MAIIVCLIHFSLGLALEPRDDLAVEGRRSGSNSTPASPVEELVWRLHQDLSFFPWLTPMELETIAKMDRDEMKKVKFKVQSVCNFH